MSILDLNIHAWEQDQVTKVTKFLVDFSCLKYILVYFTLLKNKIPGQILIKTQIMLIQLGSKMQFRKFIRTSSNKDTIIKMQIFDERRHCDVIVAEYEKSL